MLFAAFGAVSLVLLATAFGVYWAVKQVANLIQSTLKEIARQQTEHPRTLSALGDSVDALQVALRGVDTELSGCYSLARGNRAKITQIRKQMGNEESEPKAEAANAARLPVAPRIPGRVH